MPRYGRSNQAKTHHTRILSFYFNFFFFQAGAMITQLTTRPHLIRKIISFKNIFRLFFFKRALLFSFTSSNGESPSSDAFLFSLCRLYPKTRWLKFPILMGFLGISYFPRVFLKIFMALYSRGGTNPFLWVNIRLKKPPPSFA